MVFRASTLRLQAGRYLSLLLLAVLALLSTGVPPLAAPPVSAAAAHVHAAPGLPASAGTVLFVVEPEPSPASPTPPLVPTASASPTISPTTVAAMSTTTVTPEPTPTWQPATSAEPTGSPQLPDAQLPAPTRSPTTAPATGQPSATAPATPASPESGAAASGIIVAQALHLREGPGARYPIRAIYSRGTEVRVLGKDRSAHWLRVVTPDERAGWMAVGAVELRAPLAELPVVDGMLPSGGVPDEGMVADRGEEPSAASSVKLPINTPNRRNSSCSSDLSNS
ncbi:MAG: SH3 domain-containing protein [Chloroflexota bacterium]|nr:SH3 domain-containing protein [Chloroflexota bacterium]